MAEHSTSSRLSVAPMMEQGRRFQKWFVNSVVYKRRFFHVAPVQVRHVASNLRNYRR